MSTLCFVAAHERGDRLFEALAPHYDHAELRRCSFDDVEGLPARLSRAYRRFGGRPKRRAAMQSLVRRHLRTQTIAWLRRKAATDQPLQIVFWHPLFPIDGLFRRLGQVGVCTDVAMRDDYFDAFGVRGSRQRQSRLASWQTTAANVDRMFTHSRWAAAANRELHPTAAHKILTVGWGADVLPSGSTPPTRDRPPQILTVGHDYYRKGVDLLDAVGGSLLERVPEARVIAVGRPGRRLDADALRHVNVLGPLPREQVGTLMARSRLFTLFSRFEPAGHTVLEAMLAGAVPVVCNRYGPPEPVEDGVTGLVVDPNDPQGVARRMADLLSDEARCQEMASRARREVTARWTWEHVAQRIVAGFSTGSSLAATVVGES